MTLLLGLLAVIAYLIETGIIIRTLYRNDNEKRLILAWFAVIAHFAYTILTFQQGHNLDFGVFTTGSIIAMVVTLLLLLTAWTKPVAQLGIALFPLTALMLGLEMSFPGLTRQLHTYGWQMNAHILTSIIAFGLLNIAALQAILVYIQNQQLRSHPPKPIIQRLPPLQTMETLMFQMVTAGVVFLSVSLITGFLFIENLFAQHLAHKTILSILAWLVFSGLLVGRYWFGWRGKMAVKWTIAGFLALLLAYFGSKVVLELILKR